MRDVSGGTCGSQAETEPGASGGIWGGEMSAAAAVRERRNSLQRSADIDVDALPFGEG
jgi:hypothetical protein